jgi:hypothetical protein
VSARYEALEDLDGMWGVFDWKTHAYAHFGGAVIAADVASDLNRGVDDPEQYSWIPGADEDGAGALVWIVVAFVAVALSATGLIAYGVTHP